MVTTLHSDDPETTTPISESKIECVFPTYPSSKRTFYEPACERSSPSTFPNQVYGQALFLAHVYCACASSQSVFVSFRFPGQRCGPWAQSAGFLRDPYPTYLLPRSLP
jgi:hypothetical protein